MVKTYGTAQLRQKLARLRQSAGPAVKQSLEAAADLIVAEQRRLVPYVSGALHDSIKWRWGDPPEDAKFKIATRGQNELRLTIYAGSFEVYYGHWIEWGTKTITARPFFFPGYRAMKRPAQRLIAKAVGDDVKRQAAA